jgi:AcrR family transcriptional regulator
MATKSSTADERPTEEKDTKSARTRTRILDAAAQVLSTKGYAGTRLADVAQVAELNAPAIYYYFESREALIEEVLWVGLAEMSAHLTKELAKAPDDATPLDRILLAVEAHLRHELAISDYATAAIRNSGQIPDAIRGRHDAEEKKYGALWRQLFRDAIAAGQVREDLDPYLAQMLVLGSINWAAEWWTPGRATIDRMVANTRAFVLSAISA